MSSVKQPSELAVDEWVWGREILVWGYHPSHQYTFKILEPKKGRAGCLSLQYHHEKSESWFVLRGCIWALLIIDNKVCTRLMHAGDIQNVAVGAIHRIMGVSDDAQLLEPSTPDRHSADKGVAKDVVRLHCVLGREVTPPRDPTEASLVNEAISRTEEAILALEAGRPPLEYNADYLKGRGAYRICPRKPEPS